MNSIGFLYFSGTVRAIAVSVYSSPPLERSVHHRCHYTHGLTGTGHKGTAMEYIRFTLGKPEAVTRDHGFVDYKLN
jgi:hypothetical protein